MISDGFGDDPGQETIASPWVENMVQGILRWRSPLFDDLVQEARLAMWTSLPKWDGRGSLEGYLHQQARWRVQSLLRGSHTYTGQERSRAVSQRRGDETRAKVAECQKRLQAESGHPPTATEIGAVLGMAPASVRRVLRAGPVLPLDVEPKMASLESLLGGVGNESAMDDAMVLAAPEALDAVLLSYHEGEILAALAALPDHQRRYVVLRFWGGLTPMEIEAHLGIRAKAMSRLWAAARPVLAERLSHLTGAV